MGTLTILELSSFSTSVTDSDKCLLSKVCKINPELNNYFIYLPSNLIASGFTLASITGNSLLRSLHILIHCVTSLEGFN